MAHRVLQLLLLKLQLQTPEPVTKLPQIKLVDLLQQLNIPARRPHPFYPSNPSVANGIIMMVFSKTGPVSSKEAWQPWSVRLRATLRMPHTRVGSAALSISRNFAAVAMVWKDGVGGSTYDPIIVSVENARLAPRLQTAVCVRMAEEDGDSAQSGRRP